METADLLSLREHPFTSKMLSNDVHMVMAKLIVKGR